MTIYFITIYFLMLFFIFTFTFICCCSRRLPRLTIKICDTSPNFTWPLNFISLQLFDWYITNWCIFFLIIRYNCPLTQGAEYLATRQGHPIGCQLQIKKALKESFDKPRIENIDNQLLSRNLSELPNSPIIYLNSGNLLHI